MKEDISFNICGPRDQHECDSDGIPVLLLSGLPYEVEDTDENRKKYEDKICGGSVTCSKCNGSAFQKSHWQ